MNIFRSLFFIFIFTISSIINSLYSQNPVTEIRAVWLTTNWNLDWPSSPLSPEKQKKELIKILNELQQSNINTVFFQVRIRGDVFYKSDIEPYSPFLTNNPNHQNYDPLTFAIEECHKRGLECHAWIVTYPLGSPKQIAQQGRNSVVKRYSYLSKFHKGEWYLDPGHPDTRQYIRAIVDEIIRNYDIDGINFDYMRYPEKAKSFPDSKTYNLYGKGYSLDQWRRNNIDLLISEIYTLVKRQKPWVQVSCSPLGKYKTLDPMRGTWTAYESVHQDAAKWMQDGIVDAIYPMMYYNNDDFNLYVNQWEELSNGRFVVPGLGIYRLLRNEGDWSSNDIINQMNFLRNNQSAGMAFYRTGNLIDNIKGIKNILDNNYFKYPSKLPAMTWLKNVAPSTPSNLQVYKEGNYTAIEWKDNTEEQLTYTVYESEFKDININDPRNIIMARVHGNKILLQEKKEERGTYFTITASDRYHNESKPAPYAYFLSSSILEK